MHGLLYRLRNGATSSATLHVVASAGAWVVAVVAALFDAPSAAAIVALVVACFAASGVATLVVATAVLLVAAAFVVVVVAAWVVVAVAAIIVVANAALCFGNIPYCSGGVTVGVICQGGAPCIPNCAACCVEVEDGRRPKGRVCISTGSGEQQPMAAKDTTKVNPKLASVTAGGRLGSRARRRGRVIAELAPARATDASADLFNYCTCPHVRCACPCSH